MHALARGYIVRCHVMRMLAAVTRLQAAARGYLVRHRLRRVRDTASACFQAAWRGYRFRIDNEDVLQV
jgi:hypothetical protein